MTQFYFQRPEAPLAPVQGCHRRPRPPDCLSHAVLLCEEAFIDNAPALVCVPVISMQAVHLFTKMSNVFYCDVS